MRPFGAALLFASLLPAMPNDLPAPGPALPRAATESGDTGPRELYRERVEAGSIHPDPG